MAGLLWPVSGAITSPFGYRSGVVGSSDYHTGIDFGVPLGTPIYATHSGYFSTEQNYGGGLMLRVQGGGGWETIYAHTSRAAVKPGSYVSQGDLIGYSGRSGALVTGPHLHYEVKLNGRHMDPRYVQPVEMGFMDIKFNQGFQYDHTTAARQQARQLADLKRAQAEQQKFEVDRSRGILGEYAEIARSQRPARPYGIETTARAPRQTGQSSRRSKPTAGRQNPRRARFALETA
jgi:murein DD-endopeptidase MepM/ murein hydrolase activator NlpD